jgi:N-acetylglucosaminyl-diphospho-decaprenol L-rhamnosyltransferase
MITIIFLSFHSEHHIRRHLLEINIKFPIIVVDNSLNYEFKKEIEEQYKNVEVIIPRKNLGFSAGMNLGIKSSKTNYVFINSPDVIISNNSIEKLVDKISLIDNFALLGPTYLDESVNKNYHELKNSNSYKNLNLKEVKWIDNNFIINKSEMNKIGFFDEDFFMYYENFDLCHRILENKKKMYVCSDVKFVHQGTNSTDQKFTSEVQLSKSWHYSWSKYFFFKKHYGIFFALKKIMPNFLRSIKKIFYYNIFNRNKLEARLAIAELAGIANAILGKPSNFRPFQN